MSDCFRCGRPASLFFAPYGAACNVCEAVMRFNGAPEKCHAPDWDKDYAIWLNDVSRNILEIAAGLERDQPKGRGANAAFRGSRYH